jgi:hypothetical protein
MGEDGVLGADAHVAEHRQVEAAAQGRAVDRRYQRLSEVHQTQVEAVGRVHQGLRVLRRLDEELAAVEAGAERGPGAGHHDHAHGVVGLELRQAAVELVSQGDGERVALIRPVERDQRRLVVSIQQQQFVGHGIVLHGQRRGASGALRPNLSLARAP